jgi:hypothetical protein
LLARDGIKASIKTAHARLIALLHFQDVPLDAHQENGIEFSLLEHLAPQCPAISECNCQLQVGSEAVGDTSARAFIANEPLWSERFKRRAAGAIGVLTECQGADPDGGACIVREPKVDAWLWSEIGSGVLDESDEALWEEERKPLVHAAPHACRGNHRRRHA